MDAYRQNADRAGNWEVLPIIKATKSVIDVMVMLIPPFFIALLITSVISILCVNTNLYGINVQVLVCIILLNANLK